MKSVISRTLLGLLLAAGAGCDAEEGPSNDGADGAGGKSDTTATDAEMRPTTNGNVELLQAWDPLHEKTTPNFCVNFDEEPELLVGEREDTYDVTFISSREQLASKLNVDLALKAEVRGVSGDAKLKLVNEFNSDSNVMSYLVRLTSQFAVRPRGNMELTERGAEAVAAGPDAFARQCGTHYVRAIRYGTELYVLITLSTQSESTTTEIESELSAQGELAGNSLEGSFGSKLSQAASRDDVEVSIELASRGFALPTDEDEGALLAELTTGGVSQSLFDAIQQVRAAMIESTAADIEVLASDQAEGLLRLNSTPTAVSASLYSGLSNWTGFAEGETSYADMLARTQDNETYLRELGALMDRMSTVYYDEVDSFLEAQGAQRAAYQTRDGVEPRQTSAELVQIAERWEDEFRPPSAASSSIGGTYGDVAEEFGTCWLQSSENPMHDCQQDVQWDDHPFVEALLEDYHRERITRMRYWAGDDAIANYSNAVRACQEREFSARFGGGRGRLPSKAEALMMANLVAAGDFDWEDSDTTHAIWYLESEDDGAECTNTCLGAGHKMVMTVTPEREVNYECTCDSFLWGDEILPVCVPPDGPRFLPAAP